MVQIGRACEKSKYFFFEKSGSTKKELGRGEALLYKRIGEEGY